MANAIKIKMSGTQNSVPDFADFEIGELAYNYYDGRLFGRTFDGSTDSIVAIGEQDGGSTPFDTVATSRSLAITDISKGFIRAVHATTDIVLTIPTGTFTAGTGMMISRCGAALVTVTAASGVTLNGVVSTGTTHADLIDTFQAITLVCVGTNVFEIYGSHGGVV